MADAVSGHDIEGVALSLFKCLCIFAMAVRFRRDSIQSERWDSEGTYQQYPPSQFQVLIFPH